MAEKIVSPGVFTKEIDATFLPAAIGNIGAVIVGPTVKGPALVPTVVESYSEFQAKFGDTFKSGSSYYQYLTSHTAKNYLKYGGRLTIVRILGSGYSQAIATISSSIDPVIVGGGTKASASVRLDLDALSISGSTDLTHSPASMSFGGVTFRFTGSNAYTNTATLIHILSQSSNANNAGVLRDTLNVSSSLHGLDISASSAGNVVTMSFNQPGAFGEYGFKTNGSLSGSGWSSIQSIVTSSTSMSANNFQGGHDFNSDTHKEVFKLHTLSDGQLLTNTGNIGTNSILTDGTLNNIRWEISSLNQNKGTFSLLIRRGDDTNKRKQILETWNNLSLDPNTTNYISKMIGDQYQSIQGTTDDPYLQFNGNYPNKSEYVRVEVIQQTENYLDENGNVRLGAASSSLPTFHSGSNSGSSAGAFSGGSDGTISHPKLFYGDISNTNTQGFNLGTSAVKDQYMKALNLLSNADEYDFNLLLLPGIMRNLGNHTAVITKAIDVCENRGDAFTIVDPVDYSVTNLSTVKTEAEAVDSNYASMYWPWVQSPDLQLGKNVWVPPSVVMAGVYSFNDKTSAPWFAPAGLNRGVISTAVQAQRKLTHKNRDDLYESSVNPIATFPGQGVCVWGQKTLQKKSSALDRVNVRRLLIKVKKFISASSRFLLFEQNNSVTRDKFLNIVNPYLEQVKANSGLNEFKVIMDNTNNTPDIIDRNILYGQLFLQPTRTAEFIVLDFTIQPTGAAFPE